MPKIKLPTATWERLYVVWRELAAYIQEHPDEGVLDVWEHNGAAVSGRRLTMDLTGWMESRFSTSPLKPAAAIKSVRDMARSKGAIVLTRANPRHPEQSEWFVRGQWSPDYAWQPETTRMIGDPEPVTEPVVELTSSPEIDDPFEDDPYTPDDPMPADDFMSRAQTALVDVRDHYEHQLKILKEENESLKDALASIRGMAAGVISDDPEAP